MALIAKLRNPYIVEYKAAWVEKVSDIIISYAAWGASNANVGRSNHNNFVLV